MFIILGNITKKGLVFMLFVSLIPQRIERAVRGLLSPILARLIRSALAHPRFKVWALNWVFRYPALEAWLYGFAVAKGIIADRAPMQISPEYARLTPSALRIYADLKATIEQHNKGG